MLRKLQLGITAGVLGGALVGMCEAVWLLTTAGTVSDYVALFYATVLYGAIGGGMGVGVGVGLAVLGRVWKGLSDPLAWTLGLFGAFAPLGMVISMFIANKAFYGETGVPLSGKLIILAMFGVPFLLDLWLLPILLTKTPLKMLLELKGFAAAYAGLLVLTALFSFAPTGSGDGPVRRARDQAAMADRPNVLLIMVDTLRADYLGVYDPARAGTTPTLEALAADSVVFEAAHANASWTRASFATVYSSRVPGSHNTQLKSSKLPGEIETLAEVLSQGGYATGGLPNNTNVTSTFNFQQGFDYYPYMAPDMPFFATESVYQLSMYSVLRKVGEKMKGSNHTVTDFYQPAPTCIAEGKAFVEAQQGDRWMLMMHLMEPHDPYFERPYNGVAYGRAEHEVPEADRLDYLKQTYSGEIEAMDADLAELIQWLRDTGEYDNTVIIVSADHGEEFMEHGGWWHGTTLYQEQILVHLIVKLPKQEHAGTRVPWTVRHIDIAPTIADLGSVEPSEQWQGRTLFGEDFAEFVSPSTVTQLDEETGEQVEVAVDKKDPSSYDRTVFAEEDFEGNQITALVLGGWKYIESNAGPRGLPPEALFDLSFDAGEQKNIASGESTKVGDMKAALDMERSIADGTMVSGEEAEMDPATCARLEALGYITCEKEE